MYKAAIFDMDGTILNTIDDLNVAMNYALDQSGHRHDWKVSDTKIFFGSGVRVAVTRALAKEKGMKDEQLFAIGTSKEVLPEGVTQQEIDRVNVIFRDYYFDHCRIKTRPYDGILDVLNRLKEKGVRLAVVSNKQDNAVKRLVEEHFKGYFDFSLGEREGVSRKPARDMCDECVSVLGVERSECVYIGDSEIDVQTAFNSEMDCIAVEWGFRNKDYLTKQNASMIVSTSEELYNEIIK